MKQLPFHVIPVENSGSNGTSVIVIVIGMKFTSPEYFSPFAHVNSKQPSYPCTSINIANYIVYSNL